MKAGVLGLPSLISKGLATKVDETVCEDLAFSISELFWSISWSLLESCMPDSLQKNKAGKFYAHGVPKLPTDVQNQTNKFCQIFSFVL